jgi:Tol biopolymer transport system component
VPGDTNFRTDVFVHDRRSRRTEQVSVGTGGIQGDNDSDSAAISADGRFVVFQSFATNLVAGETNNDLNIFLHDRLTGATDGVNSGLDAIDGNGAAGLPAISADGRFVGFASDSTNLVPGDVNGFIDMFVYDRKTDKNHLVSVASNDAQGNGDSSGFYGPSLSADGRFVAFTASATNLIANNTNGADDVFLRDRKTGTTRRVSVGAGAKQGNGASFGTPRYRPTASWWRLRPRRAISCRKTPTRRQTCSFAPAEQAREHPPALCRAARELRPRWRALRP